MKRREPRQHQVDALNAIAQAVKLVINLPTGSGKSLIQSRAIVQDILSNPEPGVYVVLAPRIMLASQLLNELRMDMALGGVDAQYLIVNSGGRTDKSDAQWFNSIMTIERDNGLVYREMESTTKAPVIRETYEKAQREGVPFIIVGNYQSAKQIGKAGIPVRQLHADEAHYLVPGMEQENDLSELVEGLPADKKYFYTATMKFTNGQLGMNNADRFGKIFSRLPVDLINAGELLRPRLHLVDVTQGPDMSEQDKDAIAIIDAFREHQIMLNNTRHIAAKLLVVTKGSQHLDDLVMHPNLIQLRENRPNLRIFDITSANGARINGEEVSREEFLRQLRDLKDEDEAIILHVRILTEGIDVSGITGIMPLNNLRKSSFLQTLGRATRLHPDDRRRLYDGSMLPGELRRFVKPYAWIIVPIYDDLGEEMRETFTEMVRELRTFGFNPSEDVFVKKSKGKVIPERIDPTTKPDAKLAAFHQFFTFEVRHIFEEEDIANRIDRDKKMIQETSDVDIIPLLELEDA